MYCAVHDGDDVCRVADNLLVPDGILGNGEAVQHGLDAGMGDVNVKGQYGYVCEWNGEKGVVKGFGAGYAHVHGLDALRIWHFDTGK